MKKKIFMITIIIAVCTLFIVIIYFGYKGAQYGILDVDLDKVEEISYDYKIETKDFNTIYINGIVPEEKGEISEEEATRIANDKFYEEGYLDDTCDVDINLVYNLNYMQIVSPERSMWAVIAQVDGVDRCQCLIKVDSGEIVFFNSIQ